MIKCPVCNGEARETYLINSTYFYCPNCKEDVEYLRKNRSTCVEEVKFDPGVFGIPSGYNVAIPKSSSNPRFDMLQVGDIIRLVNQIPLLGIPINDEFRVTDTNYFDPISNDMCITAEQVSDTEFVLALNETEYRKYFG